jgi:hypothetical protein
MKHVPVFSIGGSDIVKIEKAEDTPPQPARLISSSQIKSWKAS